MKKAGKLALVYLVELALVAACVAASVDVAGRIAAELQARKALLLADEVLRRADETGRQVAATIGALAAVRPADGCLPDEIGHMRKLAISASYLQSVGRVERQRLVCSSLGLHTPAVALGAPAYLNAQGDAMRTGVQLDVAPQSRFTIIESDGYAAIVHQELVFDVAGYSADITLAMVSASSLRPIATRGGPVKAAWLASVLPGSGHTHAGQDHVVAQRRSAEVDLMAVVAVPMASVQREARDLMLVLVPIGTLVGVALALALRFLLRWQVSVPALLRAALRRDEFFLAYQPVVRLDTRACIGVEALLRWQRADGSMIRPDLFIPIAEEAGIMASITARVLALVERDVPAIVAACPHLHVSVNLSPRDLESDAIVVQLSNVMYRSGLTRGNLHVEATERGLIDVDLATTVIHEIRSAGMRVAIDDFGTGYSCLSYLTTLKLDYLKIDKSFIDTIGTEAPTNSVVLHIIEMAKSLNLVMIAEGVETEAQAQFLRQRGVQFAQGWLFAKPMAPDDLVRYLQADTAGQVALAAR